MGGHDGIYFAGNGCAKGNQFHQIHSFPGRVDSGHAHMTIDGGIAMTGKVLGAQKNGIRRVGMGTFNERRHVSGYLIRLLAEGSDIDDGVVGIVIDVGNRCKNPMDSQGSCFSSCSCSQLPGGCQITCRIKRHVMGIFSGV